MPSYDSINLHPQSHPPFALPGKTFDVICIGSGWAGHITAGRIVKAGLTAVIIESELFGGDCPFWACVPSKALLRPAELLHEAEAVRGVKENLHEHKLVDANAVLERRDGWTADWKDDQVIIPQYQAEGFSMVRGHGRVVAERQVEVEDQNGEKTILDARQAVVICTGSTTKIPKIPGLAEARPWTNRDAVSTSKVPQHLAIVGAGAIGCEMACAYASLGSKVSLISSTAEILPRVDPEAGAIVRQSFVKRGIACYRSTRAKGVFRKPDGNIDIDIGNGTSISASEILVAAGRQCTTGDLGLERFGIVTDGSPLKVDDSLNVSSVPGNWLYAAGDVNGRAPLSHGCKYHGRIVANAIVARSNASAKQAQGWSSTAATADHYALPQVVFTFPEVASVGLTKQKAQAEGRHFQELTAPAKTLGAKLRMDEYEDGWAQWIVEDGSGRLLGATFVGDNVADLLHASTVAIVGGLTLDQMAHAIPSFPTMSEVYLNLLEAAGY